MVFSDMVISLNKGKRFKKPLLPKQIDLPKYWSGVGGGGGGGGVQPFRRSVTSPIPARTPMITGHVQSFLKSNPNVVNPK